MSQVEEACVPSMVVHQMLSGEHSNGGEELSPSLVSHRLSTHLDQENELADITNMIEKLSKDVVNDCESHDKVNLGTIKPSNIGSINVSGHSNQDMFSEEPKQDSTVNEKLLPSTISQQVSTEESSTDLKISRTQDYQPVDDDDTFENEEKPFPYDKDDQEEDEEDFDDSNAVVYSCTLGNNLPVFIQTVGKDLTDEEDEDEDEDEDENDFAGKPFESKLVISFDGKISEISIERPNTTEEGTTKTLQDQASLNEISMNKLLINVGGSCSKEGEESTRNQIEELDITNNILEDKKGVVIESKEEQFEAEKNKVVLFHNTSVSGESVENPSGDVRDSNLSVSQDPKRKRKLLDMLLGCFRCNKKQL